ncbi:hypothetical protein BC936DRAFT_138651 [Jimgerdemannia flammicorona]|uniref:Uncharacterized protein n=1 Tax=Jimgerdemannia flammicorona TaxID=994334 RepID=A0A433DI73_9FUNG|nr:hypothetical protein BC936DRAFT_138651 [Jimgerdemannia flammicorona]
MSSLTFGRYAVFVPRKSTRSTQILVPCIQRIGVEGSGVEVERSTVDGFDKLKFISRTLHHGSALREEASRMYHCATYSLLSILSTLTKHTSQHKF